MKTSGFVLVLTVVAAGCVKRVTGPGPAGYPLVRVDAGAFWMGSSPGDWMAGDETRHRVVLTRPFLLGQTEVTQGLWGEVMGTVPPCEPGCGDNYPVHGVSWLDAVAFCNALSRREGLDPAYRVQGDAVTATVGASGYRLPTEAEWEYAARATRWNLFAGTDEPTAVCDYGNVAGPSTRASVDDRSWEDPLPCEDGLAWLAPVRSKAANGWGLHDLTGNVAEWVWDGHAAYPTAEQVDPMPAGPMRVLRGGSWLSGPQRTRVVHRNYADPAFTRNDLGFRVARDAPL